MVHLNTLKAVERTINSIKTNKQIENLYKYNQVSQLKWSELASETRNHSRFQCKQPNTNIIDLFSHSIRG